MVGQGPRGRGRVNVDVPEERGAIRTALLALTGAEHGTDALAHAIDAAEALAEHGVQAHIFTDQIPRDQPRRATLHEVRAPTMDAANPLDRARAYCAALVEAVGRLETGSGPFHVVHALSWSTAPAAFSLHRRGSVAAITFLDTLFSRLGRCGGDRSTEQIRSLESQAACEADLVIAGSPAIRRELAWLYRTPEERVRLLPADALPLHALPPDRLRARLGWGSDGAVVGFAGIWNKTGGSDLFLDMAKRIAKQRPGLRIVIAADQTTPARVEADLRRRGLGGLLAPSVHGVDSLSGCDVAVIPARAACGYRGLYRARAAGIPVLVTRTGPADDVQVGLNGRLAFPFAESLIKELNHLLDHPLKPPPDETFTWRAVAASLAGFYRDAIARVARTAERTHDVAAPS